MYDAAEYVLMATLLGAVAGSFLNVVAYRLPRHESIVKPASHCTRCGTPVKPYDNIPILSWLLLRGHCRGCGEPISPRYPLVEAGTAALDFYAEWKTLYIDYSDRLQRAQMDS